MPDVTLTDPLGRTVVLHERTWLGHIIKVHPDVADHRALVEGAIRAPEEIRYSRIDRDCRLYFGPGPRLSVRMMVVADVAAGVVKTAHLCNRVSGAAQEWSP